MGFSSFMCSKSNLSIPAFPYAELPSKASFIVVVLPNERIIKGVYDGYGCVSGVNIYETLNKFVPKNLQVKNSKELYFEGEKIAELYKFNYGEKILSDEVECINDGHLKIILKGSMNDLTDQGYTFKTGFEVMCSLLKVVREDKYEGEKFNDLRTSQSCPDQGFFYGDDEYNSIVKSCK